MEKPWIDIGTMAIARRLVHQGMCSFLSRMKDRSDFRLRWIFHLDTYPFPGLEPHFDETLKQAMDSAHLFDDAIITASYTHQGFGGSFYRILSEVRNPFLSIEADFEWIKEFSLQEILDKELDYWNFKGTWIGSISPSYWSPHLTSYVRKFFPEPHDHVTARDLNSTCENAGWAKWEPHSKAERDVMRDQYFIHHGHRVLDELGVKKLGPMRYYYDKETGRKVKAKA